MDGESGDTVVGSWLNGFKLLSGTLLRGNVGKDGKEGRVIGVALGTSVNPGSLSKEGDEASGDVFNRSFDPNESKRGEGGSDWRFDNEV